MDDAGAGSGQTPASAAGRALVNDFLNKPSGFGYAGINVDDLELGILAIEAEAAAPYREALERLVTLNDRILTPGWGEVPGDEYREAWDEARELLRREVGE